MLSAEMGFRFRVSGKTGKQDLYTSSLQHRGYLTLRVGLAFRGIDQHVEGKKGGKEGPGVHGRVPPIPLPGRQRLGLSSLLVQGLPGSNASVA